MLPLNPNEATASKEERQFYRTGDRHMSARLRYQLLFRSVRLAFQEVEPERLVHVGSFVDIPIPFKLRVRRVREDGTCVGVCCGHMASEIARTFQALGKAMLVTPVNSWDIIADAVPDVLLILHQEISWRKRDEYEQDH